MDRAKAIMVLLSIKHFFKPDPAEDEALGMAITALEDKDNDVPNKWIPVSERLPEDGERVLATHLGGLNPDKQVIEHVYVNGKFTMGWDMDLNVDSPTLGQRYTGKVIAWMPFPKPWEG